MKTIALVVLLCMAGLALLDGPVLWLAKGMIGLAGGLFGLAVGIAGGLFGLAVGLAAGFFGLVVGILGALFGLAVACAVLAVPFLIVAAVAVGVVKLVALA